MEEMSGAERHHRHTTQKESGGGIERPFLPEAQTRDSILLNGYHLFLAERAIPRFEN
jgi:hypothetical protein